MTENDINLQKAPIVSDSDLGATEKETTLTIPNDTDRVRLHSDIPTHIKWVLSIPQSTVRRVRTNDSGQITGVVADIPKGVIKMQSGNRSSQTNAAMVSYGPLRD